MADLPPESDEFQVEHEEGVIYEEEEEEESLMMLDPDNPLLARAQQTLYQQLHRADLKISAELREKEEELKRHRKTREDMGVELYSVQQQLAKLQLALEKSYDTFKMIAIAREQSEATVVVHKDTLVNKKAELAKVAQKRDLKQSDLNKLQETIRQVELYNTEMKDQIAVTRRATYKAEETVSGLEKDKQKQDLLIDTMTEQVSGLQEKVAMLDAQLIAQRHETQTANDTLAEASAEMERINVEKKQLVQHWRSAVIGMQRRDEALQAAEDELRKNWELILSLDGEIRGFKPIIKEQQELNEKVRTQLNRVKTEDAFVSRQIEAVTEQRQKLEEQYKLLEISAEQLEFELNRVSREREIIAEQANKIGRDVQAVLNKHNIFDEDIEKNLSEQMTLARGTQGMKSEMKKLKEKIHDQSMVSRQLTNQLARIRIDSLNISAKINEMSSEKVELEDELKEKDGLVEKYEQEIHRRHDELEKKQSEVDRLNRKYDQMTSNLEAAEHLGPLEATIHNMSKLIGQKVSEIQQLQHSWVKKQTELVLLANEHGAQSDRIQELHSQLAVLSQRRIRLDRSLEEQDREIKELQSNGRRMHAEISRLNDLIAKNNSSQQQLAEANLNLESEIVKKLRDEEQASVKIESQIEAIGDEKQRITEDIVEAERQCLLWDKKIQLGREAMRAIDPSVGASENASMKKEIQKMEYHLTSLDRQKEQLMQEMERAVHRRENISTRGVTLAKTGRAQTNVQNVKKQVVEFSRRMKQAVQDVAQCEREIKDLYQIQDQLGNMIQQEVDRLNDMKQEEEEKMKQLEWISYEQQKNQEHIVRQQRLVKRYERALQKPVKAYTKEKEEQLGDDLVESEDKTEKIRGVVDNLRQTHPEMEDLCEKLLHAVTQESQKYR